MKTAHLVTGTKGLVTDMNRVRVYILAVVAIVWVSISWPVRAKAAQRAGDAANLHQSQRASIETVATAPDEGGASQVRSQMLPDIPGKQVVILVLTYPPGYSGAIHRHSADVFAYVLEGSLVMGLNDGAPVTLMPGQTFYEGPNDIHTISRNASKTRPAKFLVFLIKNKGAPITVQTK